MLWYVPGRGYMDDNEQSPWGLPGAQPVGTYVVEDLWGRTPIVWDTSGLGGMDVGTGRDYNPTYLPTLLDYAQRAAAGQLTAAEMPTWERMRAQAMAVPMREISQLTLQAPSQRGDEPGPRQYWNTLSESSPDVGAVMLTIDQRLRQA